MKKIKIALLAGIALLFILLAGLNYWEAVYGRYIAYKFFDNITDGSYQNAAKWIHFYEHDSDTFDTKNATDIWVKRVQHLREQGVYPVSYRNLNIDMDDGAVMGRVTLTMSESGVMKDYILFFFFQGKVSNFGITRFQQINSPSQVTDWQDAFSGDIRI